MVILFLFAAIVLFILFNCLSSLIDGEIFECEVFVFFFFHSPSFFLSVLILLE